MKNLIAEGRCPYCGSDNLEYHCFCTCDDGGYYEVHCMSCREYFEEYHDFSFAGHRLNNGNYIERGELYEHESVDY